MTSTHVRAEILKQDGRGQVSACRREALLEEFEKSGASGAKFARLAGIKYSTFTVWVLKRRRQRGRSVKTLPGSPAGLDDAVVGAPVRSGCLRRWWKAATVPSSRLWVWMGCSSNCRAGVGSWSGFRCSCRWRRSWWR